MRRLLVVSACALALLGLLAGPAAAAPQDKHSQVFTVHCDDSSYEVLNNLRANSVTAHVVNSTSRVVGLGFAGEVWINDDLVSSFDYRLGRGPDDRVQSCEYSMAFALPDGGGTFEIREGRIEALVTPARR